MRFDDRLLTVLNQPAGDRHDVAVRWRQLVDLVARAGSSAESPAVIQALQSIRTDAPRVDESLRAAAARAVASLPLPFGLLEFFASDRLSVSAPVLAAATLDAGQWQAIAGTADEETRRFIATLQPEARPDTTADLTDTLVEEPSAAVSPPPASPAFEKPENAAIFDDMVQRMASLKAAVESMPALGQAAHGAPSLHEVVERIESRRRGGIAARRGVSSAAVQAPALFRWECDPAGEIAWVDGAPRGALIGRSIARPRSSDGSEIDQDVVRAFAVRAPFRDAALLLAGEGTVSGEWKISGVPAFDPADGRFCGYRGIALREVDGEVDDSRRSFSDPDSVRELVHEIKTPLNAIIGFAEIIEGQYLGSADLPYRERAEDIVGQARLLLTAIDDVDFVAKVQSAPDVFRRVNVGELVSGIMPSLSKLAIHRGIELEVTRTPRNALAAIEPELADRLVTRMCGALIEQASEGERLKLNVDIVGERLRLSMTQPSRLSSVSDEQLFGAGERDEGFSLRLVRRLARISGADLASGQGMVSLLLPRV